ncbi:MAG: cardiolipin synthase B, partial [Pseudomonadota bacterium]
MHWGIILLVVVAVAFVALLVANFLGGEKKITRHIGRHYRLEDTRFLDELGVLLGPPFQQGN